MVTFKSFNNIVLEMLNYLRLTQPNLDIKPNSVARDLFIDSQAFQLSSIYEELQKISLLQSIANVTGQDLVNYGSNYGLSKQTGTKSTGTVVFTFRSLDTDITIPAGSVVRTRNGVPFLTVSTVLVLLTQLNSLRATATRLRQELNTSNITDSFAIEVSVQAQSQGSSGNISAYSIISQSIAGVNSVTNVAPFTGGTDLETDSSFRSRILATFAGANVGTAIGYRSTILSLADAIDALVIEPGNPLMTRDGTQVVTDSSGQSIVTEPGTGGKVDIYVMGENNQSGTDSFVYYDQSGSGDATSSDNDYVLGQTSDTASTNLTLNSRRVATFVEGDQIPLQPVSNLVSVSGSVSGPNFVEEYLNSAGNSKGNYKLVKDTGSAGGSSFGLDKLSWISSQIDLTDEAHTKGIFNGIDPLSFSEVIEINEITSNIQVTNENSTVSSSRNYITTKHKPIQTVSRVFNLTTGERYSISNQNPDGTGDINITGRVQISGRTLPTVSDILQVDYIWVFEYDPYVDYDNFNPIDILNTAEDSVEWGFSNYIRDEYSYAILDSYNNLIVETDYPISRIISVNSFDSETSVVTSDKNIIVSNAVSNILNIKDTTLSTQPEVYNTKEDDGNFSNLLISLPTDTVASIGDSVLVTYNLDDISTSGSFVNNKITIVPYTSVASGTPVLVNYVANFSNIIPLSDISSLPISGNGYNGFLDVDGYQPFQNLFSGTSVSKNMRRSPSNLSISLSNIPSNGTIRVIGTTINKVDTVFTASSAGNTINLGYAIRKAEGLSNTATIPSTIQISRVILLNSVTTTVSNEIKTVVNEFDLTNYGLNSNNWDKQNALQVSTIVKTAFMLSPTTENITNIITTGTKLHIIFYYSKQNDYEDLFYSRNGIAFTNKVFGYISSVNRLSGFQDSGGTISGRLQINSFNQPSSNSSYSVDYDYVAPKENERITINFEYNKLITDSAEAIEDKRPVTADVLVKAATKIELDVSASIVVLPEYVDKKTTVQQDVTDNITATLSASALGTTLDSSDIINNIYNVEGVDRVRITKFNKTNVSGTKVSITAQESEYLAPGIVIVIVEDR